MIKEIEEIRKELDVKVNNEDKKLTSADILELSQRLDILIVKYLEWCERK